jgi:hypothetical protein
MARTIGSSELFNLIHSLTPEEKGYYKKFSKRHIPNGSNYSKLFDAISKQEYFEEESLRKKFRNYAVMKVYLKELITDSLLLYHKNKHPHVSLFAQIQKIHILLVKGQYPEAVRILKKTLAESSKMELFTIERYLQRVLVEINHQQLANPRVIKDIYEEYKRATAENMAKEQDLTAWELMNGEWLARVRTQDIYDKPPAGIDINEINSLPTAGTRSKIKKLNTLSYALYLTKNLSTRLQVNHDQFKLSETYKKYGDSSFNNVFILNNYIASCLDMNRFEEAIGLADEMLKIQSKSGFYYNLAFPKSILFKLDAYFHLARFNEGIALIEKTEKEMHMVSSLVGDDTALKEFYFFKLIFMFVTHHYRECWMDMQGTYLRKLTEDHISEYADYCILQLMVQYEMDNIGMVYSITVKFDSAFRKHKVNDFTYLSLIKFFKGIKTGNLKAAAAKTIADINAYCDKNCLPKRKAFGLLDYTDWLSTVADGKTLREVLENKSRTQSR